MTLIQTIREDLKQAMRDKNTLTLNTLRSIISARTNELVAKGRTPQDDLTEDEMIAVLRRLAKQRKESSEQYRSAGRDDLADTEDAEREIITAYLPQPLSYEQLEGIVKDEVTTLNITEPKQRGQLIGAVMKRTGGNIDQTMLKEILDSIFKS